MNITEFLLSPTHYSSTGWTLLRSVSRQLLPCRVPFENTNADLTSAIQGYGMQLHADARRYVELLRLSSQWESCNNWNLRLIEGMLLLEEGHANDAWHQLQLALAWRNKRGKQLESGNEVPAISISDWLVMAVVSLANGKVDTAESYASEAVSRADNNSTCCITDVLQDTRADAMTVFACIRLAQQRFQEAEMLLQLALDAHVQAGDLEQMAVDLILLADVEFHGCQIDSATCLLYEAQQIVDDKCDRSRHLRIELLKNVIHERLLHGCGKRTLHSSPGVCLN